MTGDGAYSMRVLVLAPTAADARLTRSLLTDAALACCAFTDVDALCEALERGAGALVLTEDALLRSDAPALVETLGRQPAWSNLPTFVLCEQGANSRGAARAMEQLVHAAVVERPVRIVILITALRAALEARRRQYQVRDQLEQLREATAALGEGEERLRLAAEAAHFGMYDIDLGTGRVVWSDPMLEMFGLPRHDGPPLTPDTLSECLHPADRPLLARAFERSLDPHGLGRIECEYRFLRRDDPADVRWLYLVADTVFREEPTGRVATRVVGAAVDITSRKRAELSLQAANEQLEQRVAQRTLELQRRADQLSRLTSELTLVEQRERRRLAKLLHDHLQQLLVGAKMSLEVVSLDPAKAPRDVLERIRRSMDEAITASRSLTVELAPPILHEDGLAAGLEWLARRMKSTHGLVVSLTADPGANPSREDVRTLLFESVRELLFNVVKHAGVNEARVEMGRDGSDLRIVVGDRGAGFDPASVLGAGSDARQRGFGLFSIHERLALLSGRFEIDSAPGRGATFKLFAPLGERRGTIVEPAPADVPTAPPAQRVGKDERVRVLVADDHAVVREGLCTLLGHEPRFEVVGEAGDGIEALKLALALQPDVILMDCSMPGMDGAEATRRIRNVLPEVRVIGLSMYEEPERARTMLDAGASAYVSKSSPTGDLLNLIRAEAAAARGRVS